MNKRQVELQNIIKSLQSKIHALKRQNSTSKVEFQQKVEEAISKEKAITEEKDKTIAFLKEQVNKIRKQSEKQIKLASVHYEEEQKKSTSNLLKFKNQCEHLEAELNKNNEIYEKKLKEKQAQLNKIIFKCEALERERKTLLQQRQNFNRFYQSAIHKLPERQQTLLWVDKLIEFMSKTQNILTSQLKQKESNIGIVIKFIKDQLNQISNQLKRNDAFVLTEKQKFLDELKVLIGQAQQDYDEAIKANSEFWDTVLKVRAKEETEQLSKLEAELNDYRQNSKKQVQLLHESLKNSQKEKKSLLISFQQMKNLYQIKDKASREQIELLKQSISELLESQQIRQKQFQDQIQRLGQKIEQITTKFYEKLDFPIQQLSHKLKSQIECFKSQFEGFYSDSLLQKQLENFQNHIVQYLVSLNNSKQERSILKQTAESSMKIIDMIKDIDLSPPQKAQSELDKQKLAYSTVSYTYQSNDKEFKEKENKLNYELATVKKQLEKLKEHCKQLQGKSKTKQSSQAPSRIIELAAQNQLLKERLYSIQQASGEAIFSEARIAEVKLARLNSSLLEKLIQNSEIIIKFTQRQDVFLDKMSRCISSLNTFIINPLQMFEKLTYQIDHIKIQPAKKLAVVKQAIIESNNFQAKKEAFSILLSKKNQTNTFIQKTSNELSKILRQLLSKCGSSAKTYRLNNEEQKVEIQKMKPSQSRNLLQKKIKEVQTQRIKNRQQMLGRLKILDEKFKVMEQKNIKKQGISFNKVEESITKRIQDMITAYNAKQKLKDLGKITQQAFNDLQSKLKQCMIENQGLVKETEILRGYKQ